MLMTFNSMCSSPFTIPEGGKFSGYDIPYLYLKHVLATTHYSMAKEFLVKLYL